MLKLLLKRKRILKYLIAGSIGAFINLALLYFFTDILKIWYLISASMAFTVSFFASFFLQKFWTFSDNDKKAMRKQMRAYLSAALANLALNALLMYVFVDGFKIWHMLAQFAANGIIACESYFIYKFFIFNKRAKPENAGYFAYLIKKLTGKKYIIRFAGDSAWEYAVSSGGSPMKILSIGLDNSVLDKNSALAKRVIEYGDFVDSYAVIAPSAKKEILALPEKVKVYGSGGGNKLSRFILIYKTAKKLLNKEKYGAITVQDAYFLALLGLRLAKKHNLGLEIQVHGFEKCRGLRKFIALYVLPRADSVRCVSQRLKNKLINEFGVNEEKITVVNIYSEIKNQKPETRNYAIKEKFIFLTVGRLASVKNIGLQIEAMKDLKVESEKLKVELWIAGEGPEREKLKVESEKLKVEDKVKFFGWQDNLEKFYKQADAFVLSSNSEGWGLAVIEAAGFGLPIIMTDVGCAGEVIKNRESGLVVPVGDKKKLVESMIEILENAELRKKLGENAKLAASKLPDKERIFGLYKKSWEKAVKAKAVG